MDEIKQISIEDKNYPQSLKKIADPPKVLYYMGSFIQKNELALAIVGTRRPSLYGQQATLQIAGDLAEAGLTIVSGFAPGIDTFSHLACAERSKRTIAVLGTSLDEKSIYPRQNLDLAKKIIDAGGCLISEFPLGTSGSKFTFPRRNRLISGLSLGVLVVEAKEKSGSLITAQFARKQEKKVFAVPGQIFTSNAKGTNRLIKNGAKLVENASDILEELNLKPSTAQRRNAVEPLTQNAEELAILTALKEEALYIDKIIEKTKLSAPVVATALATMEISGKIRHLGGNVYGLK